MWVTGDTAQMQHISSQSAAALDDAIEAANDLARALQHVSDLLGDSPEDTTQAVAWRNSARALRDLVRSAIAHKTQAATMWK